MKLPAFCYRRLWAWGEAKSPSRSVALGGLLGVLLLGLHLTGSIGLARERGLPAQEGIANFARVDERLYRGAQPDGPAMKNLQRLGVKSIINLRQTNDVWRAEATEACANGIVYTNVPLSGARAPSDQQVEQLLTLLETLPSPIFLHCQYGCDRTGTIVASYRIRRHRWSNADALAEAKRHGLSKLERGMRKYILQFDAAKRPER